MKYTKRASLFVVFSLVAGLAAIAALWLPAEPSVPDADLKLTLLDGRTLTLGELRGRPVLIAFWATSCPPCVEEVPDLIKLYQELRPRGFEIIAVAMSYDPPLHVQNFARQHHIPYPIALDMNGAVLHAFDSVRFIPAAFLLGPDGQVVHRHVGKLDIERTRRLSELLLPVGGKTATPI